METTDFPGIFARIKKQLLPYGRKMDTRVDKPGVFHTEWIESDQKPAEKRTEPKVPAPHHAGE